MITDKQSIDALDVAERFANGEATQEELAAARDAAWYAAWYAVGYAARAAARAAARYAARAAAGDAARDAQKEVFLWIVSGGLLNGRLCENDNLRRFSVLPGAA